MERIIRVKVMAKSSTAEVMGWEHGILKVRVSSPPIRGEANRELIALLSNYFKTAKIKVKILSGERSRLKRIVIEE